MAQEIERKFLVRDNRWKSLAEGVLFRQGYVSIDRGRTVRVRVVGEEGFLTIKGPSVGISRLEFEYEIPVADARQLLDDLCERPIIEKHRFRLEFDDCVWEVDEFHGANEGLVVAEVELEYADQVVDLPEWVGEEVSEDPRYFNSNLVKVPFSVWQE